MKQIAIFLMTLIVLCHEYPALAEEKTDYFPQINEQEIQNTLTTAGVQNCEEFLASYFDTEKKAPAKEIQLLMQATAYDAGLCVERDLPQAQILYEQAFKMTPDYIYASVRLALLYSYGPAQIRNSDKAAFFIKQTAITLASLPNDTERGIAAKRLFLGEPIPDSFQKQLSWLDKVLALPSEEREIIVEQLKADGFKNTEYIWNPYK